MPLIPSQVKRVREAVTVKLDKPIIDQLKTLRRVHRQHSGARCE
jgi:hypothetical protein